MRMIGLSALGIGVAALVAYVTGPDMAPGHMVAMGKAMGWCVLPIVLLVRGALWDKPNGGQAAPAGVVPAAGLSRGRR